MNLRSKGFSRHQVAELTRVRQSLRKVELGLARKVVPAAVRAAAEVLRAAVVREAPKDTGFLASRVKIEPLPSRDGDIALAVSIGDHDFQGKVFYAAMVEYGTSRQPANPFMQRAVDADGPRALRAAAAAIAAGLKRLS